MRRNIIRLSSSEIACIRPPSRKVPPNGFYSYHTPGTGSLVLKKKFGDRNITIISPLNYFCRAEKSVRTDGVPFIYILESLKDVDFPYNICGTCKSVLGQLIINSICFTKSSFSDNVDHTELSLLNRFYCGPHLNQVHLVNAVMQEYSGIHDDKVYVMSDSSFYKPTVGLPSIFTFFGHTPVHSVTEDVTEAVAEFLEFYGIDDSLAHYIDSSSIEVKNKELSNWKKVMQHTFVRRK